MFSPKFLRRMKVAIFSFVLLIKIWLVLAPQIEAIPSAYPPSAERPSTRLALRA